MSCFWMSGSPNSVGLMPAAASAVMAWGKGMVIVALTGWGQESDRRNTKEAGFDAHLVKPVDYGNLLQLLAALLPLS